MRPRTTAHREARGAGRAAPALVLALALGACQPAAFPRTGVVVPRGRLAAEGHLQVVSWEPQRATVVDGRELASDVAFFPVVHGAVRGSLGPCELGGMTQLTRWAAEARCGLLQESRGHPVSVASSGAFGIDYGPYTAPTARVGLDVSRRFGRLTPLVDAYLSTGSALRYLEDPGDPPIEGPLPGSKSTVRREVRLTIPVGLAIELARWDSMTSGEQTLALVVGATPWALLDSGPCRDDPCHTRSWDADSGAGFTLGVELR